MTSSAWPWDSAPPSLVALLGAALAEPLDADVLYLLIDPGQGEPPGIAVEEAPSAIPPSGVLRAREAAWSREIHSLHFHAYRRFTVADFPYLVRLNGRDDPWLATSIGWAIQEHLQACAIGAGAYRVGGWLQIDAARDGGVLARQLSTLMQYSAPDGASMMARLQDRRVLHLLHQGVPLDWAASLKGIRFWRYLDHDLSLQNLEGAQGEPTLQPLPPVVARSGLLDWSHAVHAAQTRWLRTTFPLPENALRLVLDKLKVAERRGLRYPTDQGAYAAEALVEPAFEHWPELDPLIHVVTKFRQDLSDGMDLYRTEWVGKSRDHWLNPQRRPT